MNARSNESQEASGRRCDCVVMKFGGTSVEDAAAIQRVTQLVKRRLRHHPVVVVSALARVTDQLLSAGTAAAKGHREFAEGVLRRLELRHQAVCAALVEEQQYRCLWTDLEPEFQRLHALLGEAELAGFGPAMQDRFLGAGEQLASRIVHAALLRAGIDVTWVDATQGIVTDAAHTRATPLWEETNQRLQAMLLPLIQTGQVPVLGGFVAATLDDVPTTLGRGGSDFTASIVGAALNASRIELWTHVDGVMTTDPNLCPEARRITSLSFDEASELAQFGAKVLHPETIAPAMRRDIPVWVLNSRNPEGGGTEIAARASADGRVKAITAKRGVAAVHIEPLHWLTPELLHQLFSLLERHRDGLELLSAGRCGLSIVISSSTDLPALAEELRGVANVRWENHKAMIALVGEKIRRRPDLASQVFHAISDIEVRMIGQGASERNLSFLVDDACAEETVRRLHELLFPSPVRLADDAPTYQAEGTC